MAVTVHDEAIKALKPGMTGREVNQWLERFKEIGYVAANAAPLVNGWSTYNHAPHLGAIAGTPDAKKRAYPKDLDFVLRPGHCLGIRSYPLSADGRKAVLMGTTCVMTPNGLRKLHACDVTKLRVVGV